MHTYVPAHQGTTSPHQLVTKRPSGGAPRPFDDIWNEIEGTLRVIPAGTRIFSQGAPANEVLILGEGVVKRARLEQDGQELIVDLRFPGCLLGSAPVIAQTPHLMTSITLSDCWVRRIPAGVFRHLAQSNNRLSWHLHQLHSREISKHIIRMTQLGCLSAQQRLEDLLWMIITTLGLATEDGKVRLPLLLKQQEIASLIAVTPEYLSRMMKRMQQKGTLRQEKGWLVIPNYNALWHAQDS